MISLHTGEALSFAEYRDFLKRSDLGSQYPAERFEERLSATLRNRSLCITARNEAGLLVGVCLGLTDFAYFLFLTDLGVDRDYTRRGIGSELVRRMRQEAGGEDDISLVTVSNDAAYGFYVKLGLANNPSLFWQCCRQWTDHEVR